MVPTQGPCIMRIMHFEAMHYEQFNCMNPFIFILAKLYPQLLVYSACRCNDAEPMPLSTVVFILCTNYWTVLISRDFDI